MGLTQARFGQDLQGASAFSRIYAWRVSCPVESGMAAWICWGFAWGMIVRRSSGLINTACLTRRLCLRTIHFHHQIIMSSRTDDVEAAPDRVSKPTATNAETIEAVGDGSYAGGARDKAGQLLKEADHSVVVTQADDKRILRKIDLAILPIILFTYVLQFLDKSTLSYASVFGILDDANLVGDQFSWLGAVVYVAQLVWQPVIAYMLVRFPIAKRVAPSPVAFPSPC